VNKILFPVLKVILVALLIGCIFGLIAKSVAVGWVGVLIGIVLQFLISWVIGEYQTIMLQKFAFEQRLDEERILESNSVVVSCAACGVQHTIPVLMKERNTFICRKCKTENIIMFDIQTARTTAPLVE
jgi:hypothetical protein